MFLVQFICYYRSVDIFLIFQKDILRFFDKGNSSV